MPYAPKWEEQQERERERERRSVSVSVCFIRNIERDIY
jgi:hypothetical protein